MFNFLTILIAIIIVIVTLRWMVCSASLIVEYLVTLNVSGADKEYHFEYFKIIGTFFLNFILFKEGLMQFFTLEYGKLYNWLGFINNESFLENLLVIESIILIVLISLLNRYVNKSFKY